MRQALECLRIICHALDLQALIPYDGYVDFRSTDLANAIKGVINEGKNDLTCLD